MHLLLGSCFQNGFTGLRICDSSLGWARAGDMEIPAGVINVTAHAGSSPAPLGSQKRVSVNSTAGGKQEPAFSWSWVKCSCLVQCGNQTAATEGPRSWNCPQSAGHQVPAAGFYHVLVSTSDLSLSFLFLREIF